MEQGREPRQPSLVDGKLHFLQGLAQPGEGVPEWEGRPWAATACPWQLLSQPRLLGCGALGASVAVFVPAPGLGPWCCPQQVRCPCLVHPAAPQLLQGPSWTKSQISSVRRGHVH